MPSTLSLGTSWYLKTLQEIEIDRYKFGDGIQLKHVWEFSRLLTFIHRPNIFTRANLRNSLDSLVKISSMKSNTTKDSIREGHVQQQQQQQPSSTTFLSSSSSSASPLSSNYTDYDIFHSDISNDSAGMGMGQCVGIHVRHGDSSNDIRGRVRLDRSLPAHLSCAQKMIR